jgi:hypothetical protein
MALCIAEVENSVRMVPSGSTLELHLVVAAGRVALNTIQGITLANGAAERQRLGLVNDVAQSDAVTILSIQPLVCSGNHPQLSACFTKWKHRGLKTVSSSDSALAGRCCYDIRQPMNT